MTKSEGREWFRTNTGMELPDDDEIQSTQDAQATIAKNAKDIKTEHINNMNEIANVKAKPLRKCKMCKESQHSLCTKRGCQCQ